MLFVATMASVSVATALDEERVILQPLVFPGEGEAQPEVALIREPAGGGRLVVVTGAGLAGQWTVSLRCGGAGWTLYRIGFEGSAEEATATFRVPPDVAEAALGKGGCRLYVLDRPLPVPDQTAATEWARPDGPGRQAPALVGRVMWVVDGQGVGVHMGDRVETVRYAGIVVHERPPGRALAPGEDSATVLNRSLVAERSVRIELDQEERDPLGRLQAYVYVDDAMVNAELVRRGYAEASAVGPNLRHRGALARLETEARRERRGFWATRDGVPVASELDKTAVPLDDHTCPGSHPIKGRTFPTIGRKIYYPVGSVLLERVPTEVCYAREVDAMVDGFTRSRR